MYYGRTPLPIVIKFGINVLGSMVERCMRIDFLNYPRVFKMAAVLCAFFRISYGLGRLL